MHIAEFSRTVALHRDEGYSSDPARDSSFSLGEGLWRSLAEFIAGQETVADSRLPVWPADTLLSKTPEGQTRWALLASGRQRPKEDSRGFLSVRRP